MKHRALDHAKLARNLGSQARGRVSAKAGYFGAIALAAEVRRRFKSPASGGRATDRRWTAKRLVPVRPDTLARLEDLATKVSALARYRVEPLQLAAILIEHSLNQTSKAQMIEALSGSGLGASERSRSAKPFPRRSGLRRSVPALDPPISATLIEDRKDRF